MSGWAERITTDYLVGRRFTWTNDAAPDITFVSGHDGDTVLAHCLTGDKKRLPLADVRAALMAGILVEADGVPFVLEAIECFPSRHGRRVRLCDVKMERNTVR